MLMDFTKEKFDIIIQAGQSNSEGYGVGPVDDPFGPNDAVWYMNGNFTIFEASEWVDGNETRGTSVLPFAREYINHGLLEEGRKLLILRTSEGGTGFVTGQWGKEDRLYLRMMEMIRTALALNPENRLVCFLWHQGENEVEENVSYERHYANLKGLVDSVFEEFGVPELPFITADFVPAWRDYKSESSPAITNAIRAVCKECRRGAFVESEGLKSNIEELQRKTAGWEDLIHFSRKSLYELGKRYFNAYLELIK